MTPSGAVTPGEAWSISLTVGANTTDFSYTVASGNALSDIARALAAQINANAGAGFVATTEGATLCVACTLIFHSLGRLASPVWHEKGSARSLPTPSGGLQSPR